MPADVIQIPQLGPVIFNQSFKARHLRITVKTDKTIKVTIPKNGNLNQAKAYLFSKTSWVKKHLHRIERYNNLKAPDLNMDLEKAQTDLFERLNYFSKKYNFSYNNAAFRCQKTRWGSCSSKNNINLNINLTGLPPELQDYVLLHELVHTKHKNHGEKFWSEMNGLLVDAKKLRKKIRKYKLISP